MLIFEDSLGIDIRQDMIHAVVLGKSLSGFHLLDSLEAVLPDENEVEARRGAIIRHLQAFLQKTGFKNGQVLVGIPRRHALVRFLKIPILPIEDVRRLVKFEASRHIPGSLDDYLYDTLIIEEKIGVGMRVLFVAIPLKVAESYLDVLKQVDLHPDVIDISSLNALNTIYFQKSLPPDDDVAAYLQLGLHDVELVILRGNKIQFTRSLPRHFPGLFEEEPSSSDITADTLDEGYASSEGDTGQLDSAMADRFDERDDLDVDEVEADSEADSEADEAPDFGPGDEQDDETAAVFDGNELDDLTDTDPPIELSRPRIVVSNGDLSAYIEQLAFDLHDSMSLAGLTAEGIQATGKLFISPGPFTKPEILEGLQQESPQGVFCLSGVKKLTVRAKQVCQDNEPDLLSSVGLALRTYNEGRFTLNLLPPAMRPKRVRYGFWISVVLSVLIVLSLGLWQGMRYYRDVRILERIQEEITRLGPEVEVVNSVKDQVRQAKELITTFSELQQKQSIELDVLADLTRRLPKEYWINYLLLEKDHLTIHGEGPSPESLIQLLDVSPYLDGVKLERVVNDRFTIEARVQEPPPPMNGDKASPDSENGHPAEVPPQDQETLGEVAPAPEEGAAGTESPKTLETGESMAPESVPGGGKSEEEAANPLEGKADPENVEESKPLDQNPSKADSPSRSDVEDGAKPPSPRDNLRDRWMKPKNYPPPKNLKPNDSAADSADKKKMEKREMDQQ